MLFLELFIKVIIIDIQNLLNQNFFYSLVVTLGVGKLYFIFLQFNNVIFKLRQPLTFYQY
jgi:hypothetical protein